MKKILLVLMCLMMCGCYDYKELNQISIIGGIGIDYDNEYIVSLEIINDKKTSEGDSDSVKTATINGTGKTFVEAFNNAIAKVDRDPYFYQMQVLLISENAAVKGLNEVFDYLLRESKINNSFYTVVTKDTTPQEVFQINSLTEPVASSKIVKMLKDGSGDIKFNKNDEFDLLVGKYVKQGIDISLVALEMEDGEIAFNHMAIFNGDSLITFLNKDDSITYNLLTNKSEGIYLTSEDNVVALFGNKTKKEFKDGKIVITFTADATITEVQDNIDFKDLSVYSKLSQEFSKTMQENIENLIDHSRNYNADILGLGQLIYADKPNSYQKGIGLKVLVEVNASINVNKNGITFEVIK